MQAEGTKSVPQWPTAAGFHSRAASVFGSLEGSSLGGASGSSQPWSLSQDHVFRAGKANDYSSEEEEDAQEIDRRQREFLPGSMLELEGDDNEDEVFRPSAAFCKAMDKEQEYDDTDAMAMGERLEDVDGRPAGNTEVLEENVYEQRSRQHEAGAQLASTEPAAQEPEDMQVEPSTEIVAEHGLPDASTSGAAARPGTGNTAAQSAPEDLPVSTTEQANGDGLNSSAPPEGQDEDEKGRIKKRVRFQEPWVPPHRRDDEKGAQVRSRPTSVQRQGLPPRTKSYVADHVKNPQKYTCYTLDEPILVGGGDQGSAADGGQADMERAARAAMSAAHSSSQPDQPGVVAVLPAFGSGIEFRPQSKRSKDAVPKSEVADKAKKAGSVVGQLMEQEDLHEDGQEPMEVVADMERADPAAGQPRKTRRNFRAKAAVVEQLE
ncbi:hypothetical protein COCSUDRAFT_42983 [Coccomyxa subellipsoidea C-169]|uniref:U5 small nuclear ribonucleoprotein TSSC4 n=1 Tax=Coccomyxa subellipsoidea (strain C-169) TaxID=574566 RepID=I0YUA8_COCSC|nr:hypothetical protein COCSUDRAFT_42983 [Coccomyxa subellipsoidea C-169]EIE21977.1 hypothetical protein COCSUDRAFT_42983 [Coccomyxa subellipsoidea C-169]|eukprot:XP_005646521.1 hypothetical protein COCSUDRAFT_42983 [Coccomyxa subellipsoidea C-169]